MKIVYSRKYEQRYRVNPAENPDRVRLPAIELQKAGYDFVESEPCSLQDIGRVHGKEHIERVKTAAFMRQPLYLQAEPYASQSWLCRASLPSPWCVHRATTLQPTGPGGCATSTTWPLP
jgi:acetoin utilization deacetylase AcuC-like enzyme